MGRIWSSSQLTACSFTLASFLSLGWIPLWEEVLHLIELLQVHVELEKALSCGLGHTAVDLTQLLLDVLRDLAVSKGRGGKAVSEGLARKA